MSLFQSGTTRFTRALRLQGVSMGGILIASTLVLASAVLGWAAHSTLGEDHEATQRETLERSAALLARRVTHAMDEDRIDDARSILLDAQVARVFRSCELRIQGETVLGDLGPKHLGSGQLGASAPRVIEIEHETTLADGRQATIAARASIAPPPRAVWTLELIMGIAVCAAALLLVSGLVMRRQGLRALFAIRSSLDAYARGEDEPSALLVAGAFGAQAKAYNTIITDLLGDACGQERAAPGELAAGASEMGGASLDALNAIPHGVLIVDQSMRVGFVNGAGAAYLGSSRDGADGSELSACTQDATIADLARSVLAKDAPRRQYAETHGADGETVLRVSAIRVQGADGVMGVLLLEDITQQRHTDEMLNSFIAQATHELRTPLTNIRMYAEEAVDSGAEDEQFRSDAFNMINNESRRLERIITDMLSVSELEAGSMQLRRDMVNPERIFEELKRDYTPQAQGKNIGLHFDLPPKFPGLKADYDKLTQAIHNLLGNAIKYTPEGGAVTLSCVFDDDDTMTVKVTDTGIGISHEDQAKIFERFCRASDKRVESIKGTGLGLSISREIARLHGGDLTLESQLDHGSTFTLIIPGGAVEQPARAAA